MSNYNYQAKPTKVNGIWYASQLEARMAELLVKHNVKFLHHRTFRLFTKDGEPFTYEIDFVFEKPQKFWGITHFVSAIEVKGCLSPHDFVRVEALKYIYGIRAHIVLDPQIYFWQQFGLFPPRSNFMGKEREK